MQAKISTNSPKAWFLACRPKTLTGAAAPVLLSWALSWYCLIDNLTPALLCLFFALLMQIDANLVNDYFDGVKGRDTEERLGPERAVSQGWITPSAMLWGIGICTVLACLVGLPLIYWGGPWMLAIGVACVLFCFLYTTRLAAIGLGDVLVLLFFGLVPVCATVYILTHSIHADTVLAAVAMGFMTDLLLLVNNYRDRALDKQVGKRTLVVTIGAPATEWLYLLLGLISFIMVCYPYCLQQHFTQVAIMLPSLALHIYNYTRLKTINHGRELNKVLGTTALNIFLFAISLSLAIII